MALTISWPPMRLSTTMKVFLIPPAEWKDMSTTSSYSTSFSNAPLLSLPTIHCLISPPSLILLILLRIPLPFKINSSRYHSCLSPLSRLQVTEILQCELGTLQFQLQIQSSLDEPAVLLNISEVRIEIVHNKINVICWTHNSKGWCI